MQNIAGHGLGLPSAAANLACAATDCDGFSRYLTQLWTLSLARPFRIPDNSGFISWMPDPAHLLTLHSLCLPLWISISVPQTDLLASGFLASLHSDSAPSPQCLTASSNPEVTPRSGCPWLGMTKCENFRFRNIPIKTQVPV